MPQDRPSVGPNVPSIDGQWSAGSAQQIWFMAGSKMISLSAVQQLHVCGTSSSHLKAVQNIDVKVPHPMAGLQKHEDGLVEPLRRTCVSLASYLFDIFLSPLSSCSAAATHL